MHLSPIKGCCFKEVSSQHTLAAVERFLPHVENWATCDQLSPKAFAKSTEGLLPAIDRWLASDHVYTVRYGIGCLMRYFLSERVRPEYADAVAAI